MGRKKSKKKMKYMNPMDEYIYSTDKITIPELAKKWKGVKGCSQVSLVKRCAKEKWKSKREKFWKDIRDDMQKMAAEQIAADMAEGVLETNRRHRQQGQILQNVANKIIKHFVGLHKDDMGKIKDMKTGEALRVAIKGVTDGANLERKALGLADTILKVQFVKEIGAEFVDIVTKYVSDPVVLENIARDIEALINKESEDLEEMIESSGETLH